MRHLIPALLAAACLIVGTPMADAAPAVGLVGDNMLVNFDTEMPAVTMTLMVNGVEALDGIDMRPMDGMLYGVASDGSLATIDLATGVATKVSALDKMVPEGGAVIVDFNPAADKRRFMSGSTNLRVDPASDKVTTDGDLKFETTDVHSGKTPAIVAAAYTNSHGKPEKTAMYHIDRTIGGFIRQVSPNDGTLTAIGKLGLSKSAHNAFDVHTTADGTNTAWLATSGTLYEVDLARGNATKPARSPGWSARCGT